MVPEMNPQPATSSPQKIADSRSYIPGFRNPDLYFELPAGHPRVLPDFKQGKLRVSAYCPVEIPRVFRKTIKAFCPNEEVMSTLVSPVPHTENDEDLKQLLEIWMTLFDDWFFAGSIHRASIELVLINNPSLTFIGLYGERKIYINRNEGFWNHEHISRNEELLGTLLHEMLHAFIEIYRCRHTCCTDTQSFLHASNGGLGHVTFHGPAFADSFVLIKESLKSVVKWPISPTHISECISRSMFYDQWQPDISQLLRFDLPPEIFSDPDIWVPALEARHGSFHSPRTYLALINLSDLVMQRVG